MVLCRPFLIKFEFGNVAFEEMEKRKYQEKKKTGINGMACSKSQLPLAAYGLSNTFTKAQPPRNRAC